MHLFSLVLATGFIAAATHRGRVHPFLAVLIASAAVAALCAMSVSQLGKVFGNGFGQAMHNPGLPVLAAAMVAGLGAGASASALPGASQPLARATAVWRHGTRMSAFCGLGLVAGTGASLAAQMALLSPLRVSLAGARPRRAALTLAFALSAGQAFLLPSPVVIAGVAILGAHWTRVAAFGLPLALLAAGVGACLAACAGGSPAPAGNARGSGVAVVGLVCLGMALMLVVQSVGDMPSEPWGGGSSRELVLGVGRPVIVLLAGVGVLVLATGAWRGSGLSDTGWVATAIARAAPLMLLLGAAGGLQGLAQASHVPEMFAERLLACKLGLLLPVLLAASMKFLQGSSLVAAITAAGMLQPMLASLGLDSESGRALAVLAIGAGAMAGAQANDGFFWIVADAAALRPAPALVWITGGTVLQAAASLCALAACRLVPT